MKVVEASYTYDREAITVRQSPFYDWRFHCLVCDTESYQYTGEPDVRRRAEAPPVPERYRRVDLLSTELGFVYRCPECGSADLERTVHGGPYEIPPEHVPTGRAFHHGFVTLQGAVAFPLPGEQIRVRDYIAEAPDITATVTSVDYSSDGTVTVHFHAEVPDAE